MANDEYIAKDSLHFAKEIVDQQSDFFMGGLNVDSLFNNKPTEEIIEIFRNKLFLKKNKNGDLSKGAFKDFFVSSCKRFSFQI